MLTIWSLVVPLTMESSIIITRFPLTASDNAFSFTLTEDAVVTVYTMSGVALSQDEVAAHVNNTLNGNATGVYVIEARFADGAKQVAKIAVK